MNAHKIVVHEVVKLYHCPLVLRISIARSFSDPISKQRCEGQLRTSHGQTQVHIWVIHRLLERLPRLGECAKSES
jgi:hypothetical protein